MPPEGAVPVGAARRRCGRSTTSRRSTRCVNPRDPADFKSLENGKAAVYATYCTTCHGATGMGDGPVSDGQPGQPGPVRRRVPARGRDRPQRRLHLQRDPRAAARRMPGYGRIPPEDRWHVVNYVRYLTARRPAVSAAYVDQREPAGAPGQPAAHRRGRAGRARRRLLPLRARHRSGHRLARLPRELPLLRRPRAGRHRARLHLHDRRRALARAGAAHRREPRRLGAGHVRAVR